MKTKRFNMKPMHPDEAALQLELVGHEFYVFLNAESDAVAVIYRRRDGNLGVIEPVPRLTRRAPAARGPRKCRLLPFPQERHALPSPCAGGVSTFQ